MEFDSDDSGAFRGRGIPGHSEDARRITLHPWCQEIQRRWMMNVLDASLRELSPDFSYRFAVRRHLFQNLGVAEPVVSSTCLRTRLRPQRNLLLDLHKNTLAGLDSVSAWFIKRFVLCPYWSA